MKKTISTSCPFPLIKLNVNITYAEVQKPSGVGYLILVLIKDAKNWRELLSDILKRFGVPKDLQFIFADEIEVLLNRGILQFESCDQYDRNNFEEYTIDHFSFTQDGERMFREGAIPTGEEKKKQTTVYFNPLVSEFSFSAPKHREIEKADCYPDDFMEGVKTDLSGLEEYLIDNSRQAGLQKEERLLNCVVAGREDLVTEADKNLEIRIDENGMDVSFTTAGADDFYEEYFTPDMLEREFAAKFKFSAPAKTAKGFEDFKNISAVYVPKDYKTQMDRPAKLLLTKEGDKISVKHGSTRTTLDSGKTAVGVTSAVYPDWSFITINDKEMSYYTASRVELTERVLNEPLSINLLIEQSFGAEQKTMVAKAVFDECMMAAFSTEYANMVKVVYELTDDASYITDYVSSKMKDASDKERQTEILLTANGLFTGIKKWQASALEYANEIYNGLISDMTKENVNYTVKITKTLDPIRKADKDELLIAIAEKFSKEDEVALFNIITGAGFTENEALFHANVVKVYINKILAGETELTKSTISDGFAGVANNLSDLKNNLGIRSTTKYAFREDYKIDRFVEDYRAFKNKLDALKKYSDFAQEGFAELQKYTEIMQPVFDYIMIERNASTRPEKISESYIRDKINKGDWRTAIGDMVIRLDYILGKRLEIKKGDSSDVFEKIDRAKKEKILTDDEADTLHELRMFRNKLQHPTEEQLVFDREKISAWANAVFAIEASPKEDKK